VTLDAKVIVGPASQFATSGTRLQYTLCQRDAGRNMVLEHLIDSDILVSVKIILKTLVPNSLLCKSPQKGRKQTKKKKYVPFHEFLLLIILQK
jgi:hypothetical protein